MKRLDQHSVFPLVVWAVILGLALFTYYLSNRVEALDALWNVENKEASIEDIDAYFETQNP